MIEGELPGGRPLSSTRVPAERYPAMAWVTEAWGTAPVIFAGQGKRDHLRAAIQMLSGSVPRHTVYGHLGWRRIGDRWVFLHSGGGIGGGGVLGAVEVEAGVDGLLTYDLPEPPAGAEAIAAVQASMALLELGSDAVTAPLLGGVYRAPLGEAAFIDFSIHLTGPTGVFKSELAAVVQAHFGAGFNSRRLPASWADTANMLEKKAFLTKDAVLVIDDFAPAGTTADVQRLHREADRLFRGAGNRSGRARMRADGGSRPTYYPRGLIVSTGEDIPSGQSLGPACSSSSWHGATSTRTFYRAHSEMQETASSREAMAGYLQWLAPRIDELRRNLPERQRALRDDFVHRGPAQADAGNRRQHHDRLGDLSQLCRGRRRDHPAKRATVVGARADRGSQFSLCSGRTSVERGAGHALPGPVRRDDQQRSCSCHQRRRRRRAGRARSLGLADSDRRHRRPAARGVAA